MFALAVCSAIVALFAINTIHERTVAVMVARRSAENLSESLAQQASETFEAADGALRTLAERVKQNGVAAAPARLHETMTALVATTPRIHNLTIVNERGRCVVTTFPAKAIAKLSFVDRPYFRYHRSHPGSVLFISGPARTRFDGAWVLYVTRRLDHANGTFAGVAIAPISLDYFERTYANVDVGHSGAITLFAQDGKILYRRPRMLIGHTQRNAYFLSAPFKQERSGWYIRPSQIDKVVRLYAFRRLGRYPLMVQVALAQNEYLADWRSNAVSNAIVVALIVLTIGGLAAGLGAQIGRRKRAEDSLAALALLDGLTGLANRRNFDEALEREWRHAARDRSPLAVLMIDVDNFKPYNDIYGHQQGDKALVEIGRAICAGTVRPGDFSARYGGEEFVVILPAADASSAAIVAERIRSAVFALAIPHAASPSGVATVSIGVASVVPPRNGDGSELVEAADTALYDAKRAGRNRTSVTCGVPAPIATVRNLA